MSIGIAGGNIQRWDMRQSRLMAGWNN